MPQPITKWYWLAQSAAGDPGDAAARAKVRLDAALRPGVPVAARPTRSRRSQRHIIDQSLFDVPMHIRADKSDIETVARMLIEAKNPLLIGRRRAHLVPAEKPNCSSSPSCWACRWPAVGEFGFWSKPFPTLHPLYFGPSSCAI